MPSTYFWRLRSAVQNGIHRTDCGLQDSIEVLIGTRKLGFGNCRFFHSLRFLGLADLQGLLPTGTFLAARSDSLLPNRRRNISVVGAFSRTISVPSVSGPAFQVCGYHIDCALADFSQIPPVCKFQSKPMAASGSRVVFGGDFIGTLKLKHEHLSSLTSSADIFYGNGNLNGCIKARMSLKNHEKPNRSPIYGYFIYSVGKRWCNFNPWSGSGSRAFLSSLSSCLSFGTVPDVSFDNSGHEEQVASSSVSAEEYALCALSNFLLPNHYDIFCKLYFAMLDNYDRKISAGKTLKLRSGSCYLPHPDKEDTGGEDAHFICVDEQAVGVADGVGGWADLGVDAGLYSRELMSNSVNAIQEEPKGSIDPARVLEKAHSSTKAKGSSTACIIALTDQGLDAINLGDSGFMVVRDGCTIFRSPVQQHDFNFTYQLESGSNGDLPSSGEVFAVPVAPGDAVIAGTDGLFDNLYNNEITAVVVHAVRAGLGPQVTAQKIAALARQRAQDRNRQTPFSTAAQDAGFRYYGGKLDDITVIVSYITSSEEVCICS
ncbi:probable protein phosphatase 2C 55 isoform X2 [Durio zibethinus]|uniref:Protein phosphatase n=1 Tax=Durio zibethinus TaxID=66656 RepID=A0A6P6AWU0_DURZI|nr:probable protein phosphatase 2C 55 isoform X2 [Durio zibethinus]